MSMSLDELRALAVMCPTCETETFVSRKGTCAACDTPIEGPRTEDGFPQTAVCLYPDCHVEFEINERGKAREFCSERHRKDYWFKYTPGGQAWREKDQARKNEAHRKRRAALAAQGLSARGTPKKAA